MSKYIGDFPEDFATLEFLFTSRRFSTGAPYTLAGTPSLAVYVTGSTTQSSAGVTLTADYDSVTGLNHVLIDLSADAFYATGKDYDVVIAAGTVDSVSVVGEVVAKFSIQNRYPSVAAIQSGLASSGSLNNLIGLVGGLGIVGGVAVGSTGNDTTHIHLPSLTFGDDEINGRLLTIADTTTGLRHSTWVTDWVASTALATVETLPFTPANDDFVWIQAIRRDVDVVKVNGAYAQGSGTPDVNLKQIDGSTSLVDVLKLFISVLNQSTGQLDAGSLADNTITAASLAADAGAELAALVETYIVNEGDATAVLQAVADKIAADWVAGDASPLAIVAAMLANATISTALGRLDAAVSTRASQTSVDNVQTEMNKVPRAAASVTPGGPFSRTNAGNAQTVSETFDGDT